MINFINQANLSRKINKADLFKFIVKLAQDTASHNAPHWGLFLIVGNFALVSYKLEQYIQLTTNDLDGHYVAYGSKAFKDIFIENCKKNIDGAFILDTASGQLLGNRVLYLDLKSEISEERGARHHASASASLDSNIEFIITVSEETLNVRLYNDGKVESSEEVGVQQLGLESIAEDTL